MSFQDVAKRVLEDLCDDRYDGFGVVITDSEIMRRIPKRRAVTREKEQQRLAKTAGEVLAHLQEFRSAASAEEIIKSRGFTDSIIVTQGYAQLVQAVAERFRLGDNVWTDTSQSKNVIALRFWHDPTHRRIS